MTGFIERKLKKHGQLFKKRHGRKVGFYGDDCEGRGKSIEATQERGKLII